MLIESLGRTPGLFLVPFNDYLFISNCSRMKVFVSLLLLFLGYSLAAQKTIKGLVLDSEKDQPLAGASVFLSNTSIGTVANAKGNFELSIPAGKFDLIISSIGYETYSQTIKTAEVPEFITIKLKPKAKELETIVVVPFEKDGWEKWGTFFLNNFVGQSFFAQNCTIKNKGVIKFRMDKKKDELTAIAFAPLIIENKALGYVIHYQMEEFTYDFKNKLLLYTGYPLFQQMQGGEGKKKKWNKNREQAYYGSVLHFMRSIFRNKIEEEGFELHPLKKIPNTEKQRIRHKVQIENSRDSSRYFDRILAQEDYIDIVGKGKLTGDSIAYAVDSSTAGLNFKNYLLVVYKKGHTPIEFQEQYRDASPIPVSQITLINGVPVEIEANGYFYNPEDLLNTGYWAWAEKVGMMLPIDYYPVQTGSLK